MQCLQTHQGGAEVAGLQRVLHTWQGAWSVPCGCSSNAATTAAATGSWRFLMYATQAALRRRTLNSCWLTRHRRASSDWSCRPFIAGLTSASAR